MPRTRHGLTTRQREYVQAVYDGLTNREIATRLQVAETTVKRQLLNLAIDYCLCRHGQRNTRTRLVRWAIEQQALLQSEKEITT